MSIENPSGSFHDQPVEIGGTNCLGKGGAEAMQEIEDERLLDLNLLVRPLELPNPPDLSPPGQKPTYARGDKQPDEKSWPHDSGPN